MAYPPLPLGPRDDNSPATPNQHAQDHTDERAAINDIVGVLGPAPQGSKATVGARLSDVEDAAAGASSSAGSAAAAAAAAQDTADAAAGVASAAQAAATSAETAASAAASTAAGAAGAAADAHARLDALDAAEVAYTGAGAAPTEAVAVFDAGWPVPGFVPGDFDFTSHPLSFDLSVSGGPVQHIELNGDYGAGYAFTPELFDALNGQTTGATWYPGELTDPPVPPRLVADEQAPGASLAITNLVNGDGVNHYTGIVEGLWEWTADTVESVIERGQTFEVQLLGPHVRNGAEPGWPAVSPGYGWDPARNGAGWRQLVTFEAVAEGPPFIPEYDTPVVIEEGVNDRFQGAMWFGPPYEGSPALAAEVVVAPGTYTTPLELGAALNAATTQLGGGSVRAEGQPDGTLRVWHTTTGGTFTIAPVPGNTGLDELGFEEGIAWEAGEASFAGVTSAAKPVTHVPVDYFEWEADPLVVRIEQVPHSVWGEDPPDPIPDLELTFATGLDPLYGTAVAGASASAPHGSSFNIEAECPEGHVWPVTVTAYCR